MNQYLKERNILELANYLKLIYKKNNLDFHNFSHIYSGLQEIKKLPKDLQPNDSQIVAWLFHDIIYDVSSKTNEVQSAIYFNDFYKNKKNEHFFYDLELDKDIVFNIIIDTKEHIAEKSELSGLIIDIDLSCLSGDYLNFKKNRINVLKEYNKIYSYQDLFIGTKEFLNSFKNKKIYQTEYFFNLYESKAKHNISLFLGELTNEKEIEKFLSF